MYTSQKGFIPIIIALVLAGAVGVGIYYATKPPQAPTVDTVEESSMPQTSEDRYRITDLLKLKAGTMVCTGTFTSAEGATVASIAYVHNGMLRGESTITHTGATSYGTVILKDGNAYAWTGSRGAIMAIDTTYSANSFLGMSTEGDSLESAQYSCKDWVADEAKFVPPTSVTFIDLGTLSAPKIPSMNAQGAVKY